MSQTAAGLLSLLTLVVALVVVCVPLGTWIATTPSDSSSALPRVATSGHCADSANWTHDATVAAVAGSRR